MTPSPRISPPRPEDFSPDTRAIYDRIAAVRGWAPAIFLAGMHSPDLIERLAGVGGYLRRDSLIEARERELATLAVARDTSCVYEWTHHLRSAEALGIEPELLERLAARELDADEGLTGAVVGFARDVAAGRPAEGQAVEAIRDEWGDRGVVELTILACYYLALARLAQALDVELEPGIAPRDLSDVARGK
jgi:4-carboxymuconolactone decarboxylase